MGEFFSNNKSKVTCLKKNKHLLWDPKWLFFFKQVTFDLVFEKNSPTVLNARYSACCCCWYYTNLSSSNFNIYLRKIYRTKKLLLSYCWLHIICLMIIIYLGNIITTSLTIPMKWADVNDYYLFRKHYNDLPDHPYEVGWR